MNVSRPTSPNPVTVSGAGNTAPSSSRETPRVGMQPATVSGNLPPPSKVTKTPTLSRLKTQLSLQNLTGRKKSAGESPSGEAVSGSRASPFSFFSSPLGGISKRTPTLEWTEDMIAGARETRAKQGEKGEFDQWMSERLEKSSKTEVAKELHGSAQAVIDKQLAEEKSRGTGKRFKEWIKKEEANGATVFAISHNVEIAQTQVSKLREAGVKKAVEKGANEEEARKNFDLQIMEGRTIMEAHAHLNVRAFQGNNDSAAPQYLTTEQKEQMKKQEMGVQKKNQPAMDYYDRELADLESDSSSAETREGEVGPSSVAATSDEAPPDRETTALSPAEKRKNREEKIAAAREALGSLTGAFVATGDMNLPGH